MIKLLDTKDAKIFYGPSIGFLVHTRIGNWIVSSKRVSSDVAELVVNLLAFMKDLIIIENAPIDKDWLPYSIQNGNLILDPLLSGNKIS